MTGSRNGPAFVADRLAEITPLARACTDRSLRDPYLATKRHLDRVVADAILAACHAEPKDRETLLRAALTLYESERGLLTHARHCRRQVLRREIALAMLEQPELRPERAWLSTFGVIDRDSVRSILEAIGRSMPNWPPPAD